MTDEGTMRVGVVGADTDVAADAFAAAGVGTVVDGPAAVLDRDIDAVATVGESGLLSVARCRPDLPVLPVEAGTGVRSVPAEHLADAAAQLATGDWTTERHPLLSVDDGTEGSLALFDAMTVTSEPAHISEFSVTSDGEAVAQFRADGLVVATPAGTGGYARAAGAPVIPPESSVLAIVPIAPFATTLDHWVVPDGRVTVTVERDDASVDVLADDRTVGTAAVGTPVGITADDAIETIRLPAGRSPFATPGTQLEKL